MPMSRYQIRNEYSLADPELYGAADKDDPEALLEGVAMAGLVGVLRQLGDLAEFAAEIFHDLHEEVMATATRGHGLTVRVKQLEAEFPLIEKAFLSQTSPSAFFSNAGTDWHPNLHTNQNLITGGDLPRFIMDSYEECRGPPRLFLLDKFDVAGAGACLKRYTDPSFFKVEVSSYGLPSAEVQKEKRSRKSKKKGSRWRNAGTPEFLPASHAKLHQLFLEERVENGVSDPARLVKLKRRFNGFPYSKAGKSFMEKFINVSSPEDKLVHEIAYGSSSLELPSETVSELGNGLPQSTGVRSLRESLNVETTVQRPSIDEVFEDLSDRELSSGTRQYPLEVVYEKEIAVDGESKTDGYKSDDVASEVDNYMDALATMESEIDTETEFRTKYDISVVDMEKQGTNCDSNEELLQVQYSDSQSTRKSNASDDVNNSVKKGSSSFSYSDSGSTAAENVTVDVAAKVLPSSHVSEAEVGVMSKEKFSTSEKLSLSQIDQPPKLDASDDTSNEVCEIPSYRSESGEPSFSLCISDSAPAHLPLDEISAKGALSGPHLVKTFSNSEELETKFIKTEENNRNRGNNIPWNSRHSRIPLQTQADEPPKDAVSSVNHNSDKLRDDPDNLSSASIQISERNFEVIPKKYGNESSKNDLLEAEHEEEICTEDLVDSQIRPPHSVILHAEDEPSVPAFLDFRTSNTVLQPGVVDSAYNVSPSAKEITVSSEFASVRFDSSSIAEQQEEEVTNNVSPENIASAVDTYHEEKTAKGILQEADNSEIDEIICNTSLTGSEAAALNNFTDYLNSSDRSSFTESAPGKADDIGVGETSSSLNLVGGEATEFESASVPLNIRGPRSLFDDKETKVSQPENSIVATLDADHDSDADKVDSSSERNLPTGYSHSMQESDQFGFEVYDKSLPKNIVEASKQTSEVYQEIASPDSDYVQSETALGEHSVVSYVPESFLSAEAGSSLPPDKVDYSPERNLPDKVDSSPERNLPTDYSHSMQESDQFGFEVYDKSLPKNIVEASKQTSEVYQEMISPDLDHVRSETAVGEHSDSEMVSYDPESFLSAEAGSSLPPEQSNSHKHSDDSLPSPTHHVPEQRTHFEQKCTLQADQVEDSISKDVSQPEQLSCLDHLDEGMNAHSEHRLGVSKPLIPVNITNHSLAVDSLFGDEASAGLSSKLDSNYSDNGGNSINIPRSSSVLHLEEAIKSELSQSLNNEANISEQGTDQLSVIDPGFPLLLEVPQVDLPEMPPMPPLPPVQWRVGGRIQQHASMPSDRDSGQNTFGVFQPTFPFKTVNTTQLGYQTLNRDDLLLPTPVLPLSAVKNEDHQHVNEHVVLNMAHSSPLSMQMPVTSSNRNSQDDLLTSDSTSNMNPFLRLSSTDNENPSHGISAAEAASMHSSSTRSSSVTTSVDAPTYVSGTVPSNHLNQMPPEVEPESISESAEVRVMKFLDTSSPQTIVPNEQPIYVATTSESETVWSTSNASSPAMEDGTTNGNRQLKFARPRTPLIDAVAAHDKSMLRKVTERARPEIQKVEERDTLLEQIRAKSFNLKPAVVTRPSIQGPKTNLRVAAILEKANAIRQALAGSDDEDEDEDSWSDS